MRTASKSFAILALLLALFGAWGMFSAYGLRYFDEMSGMIPFLALLICPLPALAALVTWWLGRRRAA